MSRVIRAITFLSGLNEGIKLLLFAFYLLLKLIDKIVGAPGRSVRSVFKQDRTFLLVKSIEKPCPVLFKLIFELDILASKFAKDVLHIFLDD